MRLSDAQIFVLIDDARPGGRGARLFNAPREIIAAASPDGVAGAMERLRRALDAGYFVAGYLAYGAAPAFEPRVPASATGDPLLWFGVFDSFTAIPDAAEILPDGAGAWAGDPAPQIEADAYRAAFARVQELIRAGDIYQANLTFPARVPFAGSPLALYAQLRLSAAAGHGALISTGERMLLSLSPELFFEVADGVIATRPMKGTALRDPDPRIDRGNAAALARDPKQRAENLMIVDLLRNDLSRVAVAGTVRGSDLFTVEHYPTVHQMVSSVSARLAPGRTALDALAALFPCGSVTGAPKIRAMQVLDSVEPGPRGVYTGAIGSIAPDGDASFNVAIRTLEIEAGAAEARLGLGSGVVADSAAAGEWEECIAKSRFVTARRPRFDLIETMRFDPEQGIALLDRHLARMRASAAAFGFAFDRHAVRNALQGATFRLRGAARVRLLVSAAGETAIGIGPLPAAPAHPLRVAVMPLPVDPRDFRLRHKTTDRAFYDAARRGSGADEVVFVDPEGWLTEGSFTSLFVERGGRLLTPPLARGLLPGVLRAELIATGRAIEQDLRIEDLAGGFLMGNAVRGIVPAVTFAEALDPVL